VPPAPTSCLSARWTPSDQFAGGACCGAVTAAANCDRKKSWTTKQHDGGAKQKKQPPYFTPLPPPSSSWIFLHPPTTFSYAQPVSYSLKSPGCDISSRSALFLTCHVHPLFPASSPVLSVFFFTFHIRGHPNFGLPLLDRKWIRTSSHSCSRAVKSVSNSFFCRAFVLNVVLTDLPLKPIPSR
jgi:hypothetical protein